MYKLREIARRDLQEINKWRSEHEMIDNLGAPYRYIDLIIDEKWYENYLNNRNNNIRCSVVDEKDEICALISLCNINYINRNAILHIMVGSKNQNRGIGTFSVKEMLKHAFYDLNLERVELHVLEENIIAQKLYKKCGFNQEGIMKKACYKNGNYLNMIQMAILKEEFFE